MSPVPHPIVLRGAAAMASAAIRCGVPERVAVERANNIAQILSLSPEERISGVLQTIRDTLRGVQVRGPRHDLVAAVGAAWSITIGGYPIDQVAEELLRRELARREGVRGALQEAS